jgi:hypothetical protein
MNVSYCTATSDVELNQILNLQRINHASSLSETIERKDGFVTVMHSYQLLKKMNDAAPQIIAKDGENVIGYALVMLRSFVDMIPLLQPMFDRLAVIKFGNRRIIDHSFYIMGQICIDKLYRGTGVFDALYQKHHEIQRNAFELCVTSVSTSNHRSMRAHERVGFQVVDTFRDATDEWSILVWQF